MRSARDEWIDSMEKKNGSKIEIKRLEACPQVVLSYRNEEGRVEYGIYLFIEEVVKLVRHINITFMFSKSHCLSARVELVRSIEKYKDDNFF